MVGVVEEEDPFLVEVGVEGAFLSQVEVVGRTVPYAAHIDRIELSSLLAWPTLQHSWL